MSRTVAEGIEIEEAAILQEMGNLYGQGYFKSRLVKSEIVEGLFFKKPVII